jgi:hypothetical protein
LDNRFDHPAVGIELDLPVAKVSADDKAAAAFPDEGEIPYICAQTLS